MTIANKTGNREFSNFCLHYLSRGLGRVPVVKRLYPSLLKLWARTLWTGGYTVKKYRGVLFLINYRNFSDRKIALHGSYESAKCNYLLKEMEKRGCDVFIDIGASMGIYALQAAARGLVDDIHAIEPDPRNYAQLMGNIYLNKFTNIVKAHQVALSSSSGPITFELAGDTKTNLTQVRKSPEAQAAVPDMMGHLVPGSGETCQIMARPLDEIVSYQGKKIFVKIDIQGHEFEAFKGMTKLLRDNDCFVQVAIWPENEAKVMQQIAAIGYKVVHAVPNDYYLLKQV